MITYDHIIIKYKNLSIKGIFENKNFDGLIQHPGERLSLKDLISSLIDPARAYLFGFYLEIIRDHAK